MKIKLLKDILYTHFEKLNNKKIINIIVVGGFNLIDYNTVIKSNIETWNNPQQCKYSDMVNYKKELQKKYGILISHFDPSFPKTLDNIEISHYKDSFNLNTISSPILKKEYYKKDAINIVISFTPFDNLNENWPNNDEPPKFDNVKDFNIIYIICGCVWDKNFPIDIINNILKYNLKTPLDTYNVKSYLYMIKNIELFNKKNIYKVMKPYILPIFQILGDPSFRGFQGNNYKGNNEMKNLIVELLTDDNFKKNFTNEQINIIENNNIWNHLDVNIKNIFCKLVYGIDECKYHLLSE